MKKSFPVGKHKASLTRKVKFYDKNRNSAGVMGEHAGEREAALEVEIDFDALVKCLKGRALTSAGRKSCLQGGAITLRVVKGSEVDTIVPHVHNERCYKDNVLACGCE